jgi:hypothetical protein
MYCRIHDAVDTVFYKNCEVCFEQCVVDLSVITVTFDLVLIIWKIIFLFISEGTFRDIDTWVFCEVIAPSQAPFIFSRSIRFPLSESGQFIFTAWNHEQWFQMLSFHTQPNVVVDIPVVFGRPWVQISALRPAILTYILYANAEIVGLPQSKAMTAFFQILFQFVINL